MTNQEEQYLKQVEEAERQAAKELKLEKEQNRLKNRFDFDKPWLSRNSGKRQFYLVWSYFLNVCSAAGLFYTSLIIFEFLPFNLNWVVSFILLGVFEYAKRQFSDGFWDRWFALGKISWPHFLLNFVACFGLSLIGSVVGIYLYAINNDPGAATLRKQLEAKEAQVAEHLSNRNSAGEIYWPSQEALNGSTEKGTKGLYAEIEEINQRIKAIEGETMATTQETGFVEYKAELRWIGGILITIILEILFEMAMRWMSKHDWQLKRRNELLKQMEEAAPTLPQQPGSKDLMQTVQQQQRIIEKLEQTINALTENDKPTPDGGGNGTKKKRLSPSTPVKKPAIAKRLKTAWRNGSQNVSETVNAARTLGTNRSRSTAASERITDNCTECGTDIRHRRKNALTCSTTCKNARNKRRASMTPEEIRIEDAKLMQQNKGVA